MPPRKKTSAAARGCWKGSKTTASDIQTLVHARKLPAKVQWRAPDAEILPEALAGERVVFLTHFERGFGLPASTFFRDFLDFHQLQPHHLAANFIMILSGFVTLCEGYLGCRPSIGFWKRFLNLRAHNAWTGKTIPPASEGGQSSHEKDMTDCGSCLVAGAKNKYKGPEPVQSCKNWQTTFFYVISPDKGPDLLNLPKFSLERPIEKHQWACKYGVGDCDIDAQEKRVAELERGGLLPTDLVATWIQVRVLPLQRRVHRICDMSNHRDPTRICTRRVKVEDLVARVKLLTASPLPVPFQFGLECLSRRQKSPVVCSDCFFPPIVFCFDLTSSLTFSFLSISSNRT